MKTKTINLYLFDECPEELKTKILDNYRNINTEHEWYDMHFDDARTVGIKINTFDTYSHIIKCEFIESARETAELIIQNHGESTETYKLATQFLSERDSLIDNAPKDDNGDFENEYALDKELDALEGEFLQQLSVEYLSILRRDYEYLTSDEAIAETLEANEYYFNEQGKIDN